MNWLDISLIILFVVLFGLLIWWLIWSVTEGEPEFLILIIPFMLIILFLGIGRFLVLDKSSGSTIGIVTSVDKNFFGTTAIYIKTTETNEEKYCIENNKIVEEAKNLIGSKVKISYGTRVGWYSTSKCQQSPLTDIQKIEDGDK